ncbi:hypothetical protein [Microvirga splendida]|uniref:DUF1453 domain-containing protein n=1 Tax=Microvirga splendida TaxID=2795727 RepID=A0ABS0Y2Q5_9HYPH|nr:hypothetical protein [Microvirga splendida]MBJ6126582.1 hypothetical protein [Microvirga splendida]
MNTIWAIIAGTPLWVWAVLGLVIYLGMTALKPGSRSPLRLSVIPGVFLAVALGTLLHSSRLPEALPFWLASGLLGIGIGAIWAMLLPIGIDRAEGHLRMPGTAFWLVTGLLLFGMRYALEVYSALGRNSAQEHLVTLLPYTVTGLGTGMSVGWWAALMTRYFRAAGP